MRIIHAEHHNSTPPHYNYLHFQKDTHFCVQCHIANNGQTPIQDVVFCPVPRHLHLHPKEVEAWAQGTRPLAGCGAVTGQLRLSLGRLSPWDTAGNPCIPEVLLPALYLVMILITHQIVTAFEESKLTRCSCKTDYVWQKCVFRRSKTFHPGESKDMMGWDAQIPAYVTGG